ncbi:MAG: oligosaccharide flippase family protein [Bacteroidales bacterium]|jgi:PST family polysaccharide transporter|nr:oligosaccharide flippase family protein [Bacteroidales bacterium]
MGNSRNIITKHKKVFENYFFMTFLQVVNVLIGIILFPYLIRTLGKDAYGTFVFIASNVNILGLFVTFGFDFPALKKISLNPDSKEIKSKTVSEVMTAKLILFTAGAILLAAIIPIIPFLKENMLIYAIVYVMSLGQILMPYWYFQGIQKIKFVTYVNIVFRLASIPLIFIFVKTPQDLLIYTILISVAPFCGGIFTQIYLQYKEHLSVQFVKPSKQLFKEALPFFYTLALGTIKQEFLTFFIGTFFSMDKVAIYDLANKIISAPRVLTNRINAAIFPDMVKKATPANIKKVFRYEKWIGIAITILVAALGYPAVLLFGGRSMLDAFPMAVILSATIFLWLIVGCYINFVFVPQNKYYLVTKNQLTALVSFIVMSGLVLVIYPNMLLLVIAFTLSHVAEWIYCYTVTKKQKLLE